MTDHERAPLVGSGSYVLHMRKPPPVTEGWSLTVYTTQGFLVPNPLSRYQFNQASTLAKNPDGSVDILLQAARPRDPNQARNWLPTPATGGFEVIWRLLAPKPQAIGGILDGSGWEPPGHAAPSRAAWRRWSQGGSNP